MLGTGRTRLGFALLFAFLFVSAGCDSGQGTTSSRKKGDWRTRFAAGEGQATKDLAAQGSAAVPTLITLLEDDDMLVVQMAAMTVKKLGKEGIGTMPALFAAFKRFPLNPYLPQAIKAQKEAALPEIVNALQAGDVEFQAHAAKLLNGLAGAGEPAVDALLVIVQGSAPNKTKIEVMGALASIGVLADERARPVLQKVVDGGGELGKYAGRAIKRLDSAQNMARIRAEDAAAAEAAAGN